MQKRIYDNGRLECIIWPEIIRLQYLDLCGSDWYWQPFLFQRKPAVGIVITVKNSKIYWYNLFHTFYFQKIGSGEPKSSPDDLKLDVAEKQEGFIEQETLAKNQATSGLTPAEELASVTQKKDALEKQRLSEKEIRGLNKILFECRGSAQGMFYVRYFTA